MNRIKKRSLGKSILTLVAALTLTFGMSMPVFAASSATGAINGYTTRASSSISPTGAGASTSYEGDGTVVVSATYSYVNTNTLETGTSSKNKGYYSSCSVSFTAPSNCRSVKINSSHSVHAYGQTWSTSTSDTY